MASTFSPAEESSALIWVANTIRHGLSIRSEQDIKKKIAQLVSDDTNLDKLELSNLSDGKLLCAVVLSISPTQIKKTNTVSLGRIAQFQRAAVALGVADFELFSPPDLFPAPPKSPAAVTICIRALAWCTENTWSGPRFGASLSGDLPVPLCVDEVLSLCPTSAASDEENDTGTVDKEGANGTYVPPPPGPPPPSASKLVGKSKATPPAPPTSPPPAGEDTPHGRVADVRKRTLGQTGKGAAPSIPPVTVSGPSRADVSALPSTPPTVPLSTGACDPCEPATGSGALTHGVNESSPKVGGGAAASSSGPRSVAPLIAQCVPTPLRNGALLAEDSPRVLAPPSTSTADCSGATSHMRALGKDAPLKSEEAVGDNASPAVGAQLPAGDESLPETVSQRAKSNSGTDGASPTLPSLMQKTPDKAPRTLSTGDREPCTPLSPTSTQTPPLCPPQVTPPSPRRGPVTGGKAQSKGTTASSGKGRQSIAGRSSVTFQHGRSSVQYSRSSVQNGTARQSRSSVQQGKGTRSPALSDDIYVDLPGDGRRKMSKSGNVLDYSDPISFVERVKGFNVPGAAIFPDANPDLALKTRIGKRGKADSKGLPTGSEGDVESMHVYEGDADLSPQSKGASRQGTPDQPESDDCPTGDAEQGDDAVSDTESEHSILDRGIPCVLEDQMENDEAPPSDGEEPAARGSYVTRGSYDYPSETSPVVHVMPDGEVCTNANACANGDAEVRADGEVCAEGGACSFGFVGGDDGAPSSIVTTLEREANLISGPDLPFVKGYMYKKSPSKRKLHHYQRRFCVLKHLHLAWWDSERQMMKSPSKGCISLVFHECIVVVDQSDQTKFALAPRDGRWENPSSFTGGCKRIFSFACTAKGGHSRDTWLEILAMHIHAARKVRRKVGNLSLLTSPHHVLYESMK